MFEDALQVARVAHEVNRAYCQALGDNSQPAWEDAPLWQRESALLGVKLHTENPDAGPQASHESWMAQKVADGWIYGPEKRPDLKQHHCIVPFADLLLPAIELAERGHGVGLIVSDKWGRQIDLLKDQPGFAAAFMPRGRAPQPGERFVFAEAGASLRKIALTRGEALYRGEIAEKLVAHSNAHGGGMTLSDLANYRPEWVTPIAKNFAGFTVHEIPPNGQGIAALMALGMLDKLDLGRFAVDSVESQHLQIEAMKLAFADTYRWVADGRYMTEVTAAQLLDDAYLAQRAKRIDPRRASDFAHGTPPAGGTIYLTAVIYNFIGRFI